MNIELDAHAAGYAQATADAVAWLRSLDDYSAWQRLRGPDSLAADIEQGAHRGAAKDEAPRGGSEGA